MDAIPLALPADLFTPAETRHYKGAAPLDVLKAGVDLYSFSQPVRWSIDVTNTGDALLVTGSADGRAETSCARCLDPVPLHLIGEIEGFYLIDPEDEPDDLDADEYEVLSADHVIDVAPLIEAALLLEVPLVPLCTPDCRGLCPQCGCNLNEETCACGEGADAERSADNPFSVLKDIDFGN